MARGIGARRYGRVRAYGPTFPVAATAVSATASSATRVVVTWTHGGGDGTAYYVHRLAAGSAAPTDSTTRTSPALTSTSWTDNGAARQTAYDYWVEVVNAVRSVFSASPGTVTTPNPTYTGARSLSVTTGLILALDADEVAQTDGTTLASWPDVSGADNDATGAGSPTFRNSGGVKYASLNGSSQYFTIPYTGELKTLVVIARTTSAATAQTVVGALSHDAGSFDGFELGLTSSGAYQFARGYVGDSTPKLVATGRTVTVNAWFLQAGQVDGDEITVRANGGLAGVGSASGAQQTIAATIIGAGYTSGVLTRFFSGDIRLVLGYDRALSDEEIAQLERDIADADAAVSVDAKQYIFATFRGQDTLNASSADNRLYLMESADATTWRALNNNPVYDVGNAIRDPSIIRANGYWWVAYTFTNDRFGLARSKHLGLWENRGPVVIAQGAGATWAPEWFRDDDGSLHLLVAVSPVGIGPFVPYELHPLDADMSSWSTPVQITGTGFPANMMDLCLVQKDGTYYLWHGEYPSGQVVTYATSSQPFSGYTQITSGDWAGWGGSAEAPTLVELAPGHWRIWFDQGPNFGHHVRYSDSTDGFATWSATTEVTWPGSGGGNIRHGTVREIRSVLVADAPTNGAPTAPGAFISPAGPTTADTSIDLAWGAATDPDGDPLQYELRRRVNGGAEEVVRALAPGRTATDTTLGALAQGDTVVYYAYAHDGHQYGPPVVSPVVTIDHPQPPGAPTITGEATGPREVTLTLGAGEDATGHELYRDGVLIETWVGAPPAEYVDAVPSEVTDYLYRLVAINAEGETSASVIVTTPGFGVPPDLTVNVLSPTTATLDVNRDALALAVYYETRRVSGNALIDSATDYTNARYSRPLSGLQAGTAYTSLAYFIYAEGRSDSTVVAWSTPAVPPPPPVPAFTSPAWGQICTGSVQVAWAGAPGPVTLRISSDLGATWTPLAAGLPASGSFALNTASYPDGLDYQLSLVDDATGEQRALCSALVFSNHGTYPQTMWRGLGDFPDDPKVSWAGFPYLDPAVFKPLWDTHLGPWVGVLDRAYTPMGAMDGALGAKEVFARYVDITTELFIGGGEGGFEWARYYDQELSGAGLVIGAGDAPKRGLAVFISSFLMSVYQPNPADNGISTGTLQLSLYPAEGQPGLPPDPALTIGGWTLYGLNRQARGATIYRLRVRVEPHPNNPAHTRIRVFLEGRGFTAPAYWVIDYEYAGTLECGLCGFYRWHIANDASGRDAGWAGYQSLGITVLDGSCVDLSGELGCLSACPDRNATVISWDSTPPGTYALAYRQVGAPAWTELGSTTERVYVFGPGVLPPGDYEFRVTAFGAARSVSFTVPEQEEVPLELCIGADDGALYQADRTPEDGGLPYVPLLQTNPIAPAGRGGECLFRNLYLVMTWDTCVDVLVTPIIDGRRYEEQAVLISLENEGSLVTRRFEIPLWTLLDTGNPLPVPEAAAAATVGQRGTAYACEIKTVGPLPCGTLTFEGIELEYEEVRESQPGIVYTAEAMPDHEITSPWGLVLGGAGELLDADSGASDDGQPFEPLLETNWVAPAGVGGECAFRNLYLTLTHSNRAGGTITVTPIVDGERLEPTVVVLSAVASGVLTEVVEVPLWIALRDALGQVAATFAARGCWFAAEIKLADAAAGGLVVLEGMELEYDVLRESLEDVVNQQRA